jgi:hypothetical protein
MADPSVSFVPNFSPEIVRLFQEDAEGIRGTVRTRTITGKSDHWERLGGLELEQVTSRHQATPYTPGTFTRRRVNMADWAGSERLDQLDEIRMMINPKNEHTQNLLAAWRRVIARAITDALDGNALSVSNTETTSTVALPASQAIANGSSGFTVAKLRQAKRLLDNAGVPATDRHILTSAYAVEDLLSDTAVTSSDYSTLNALSNGGAAFFQSGMYMGFTFHIIADAVPDDSAVLGATVQTPSSPILPKSGNIRTAFAYHKSAIGLSFAKEATVEVDRRPDLMNLWQVMVQGSLGATRILDAGVVTIDFDESA